MDARLLDAAAGSVIGHLFAVPKFTARQRSTKTYLATFLNRVGTIAVQLQADGQHQMHHSLADLVQIAVTRYGNEEHVTQRVTVLPPLPEHFAKEIFQAMGEGEDGQEKIEARTTNNEGSKKRKVEKGADSSLELVRDFVIQRLEWQSAYCEHSTSVDRV